jgi:hypothetical protein
VEGLPLVFSEIVTLVVSDELDQCPLRQGCRFVENEPTFLNTGSKAHESTLRVCQRRNKVHPTDC